MPRIREGCGMSGPARARSSDHLAADRDPRRDRTRHRATEAGGDHAQACRLAASAVVADPPPVLPGVLPEPAVGVDRARVADRESSGRSLMESEYAEQRARSSPSRSASEATTAA